MKRSFWFNVVFILSYTSNFYSMNLDDYNCIVEQLRIACDQVLCKGSRDEQRDFFQRVSDLDVYGAAVWESMVAMEPHNAILKLMVIKNNARYGDSAQQEEAIQAYSQCCDTMQDQLRVLQIGMVPYENLFASAETTGAEFAMRLLGETNANARVAVAKMDTMLTNVKQEKAWQAFHLLNKQARYMERGSLLPSYVDLDDNNTSRITDNSAQNATNSILSKQNNTTHNVGNNNRTVVQRKLKKKKPYKSKQYRSKQSKNSKKKEPEPVSPYMLISYQPLSPVKKDNSLVKLKNNIIALYKNSNKQNQHEFYHALFAYRDQVDLWELSAEFSLWLAQIYSGEIPYDIIGTCKNRAQAYQYYKHALKKFREHESKQLYISEFKVYIPAIQCQFADFLCKEKIKERYSEACTLYNNAVESGYEEAQFRKVYLYILRSKITEAYNECKKITNTNVHTHIKALGTLFSAYLLVHFKEWSKKQSENPINTLKQYCNLMVNVAAIEKTASMIGADDLDHVREVISYLQTYKNKPELHDILFTLSTLLNNMSNSEVVTDVIDIWMFCAQYGHIPSLTVLADYAGGINTNNLLIFFQKIRERKQDIPPQAYTLFFNAVKAKASCVHCGAIDLVIKECGEDCIEEILNSIVNHKERDKMLDMLLNVNEVKPEVLWELLMCSDKFKKLLVDKYDGALWLYVRLKTQLMIKEGYLKSDKPCMMHLNDYKDLMKTCDMINDKPLQLHAYNLLSGALMKSFHGKKFEGDKYELFTVLFQIIKIASEEWILKGVYKILAAHYLDGIMQDSFKKQFMEIQKMDEKQLAQWCVNELLWGVNHLNDYNCRLTLCGYWLTKEDPTLQEVLDARKYVNVCRAQGIPNEIVQQKIDGYGRKVQTLLQHMKLKNKSSFKENR